MADDLGTHGENTWCIGCGDFGILTAVKKAVRKLEAEHGIPRENVVMGAGIGCFGKIFDYLNLTGLYGLHGRAHSNVQGMKLGNPDLKPIVFVGDGDGFGEGLAHLIFAAKRNADITVVMHDNEVYALTTGQFTPTSEKGWPGPSTPGGSTEEPLNPLAMILEAGATFVAQTYSARTLHLVDVLIEAVNHKGFSFVSVKQPCVSFHDMYAPLNSIFYEVKGGPKSFDGAMKLAKDKKKLPIGVYYKVEKPSFPETILGSHNPYKKSWSKAKRHSAIKKLLKPKL